MSVDGALVASSTGVRVVLGDAFVALRTDAPHRALSFAPQRGGWTTTRSVVIHQVKNADLPVELDPLELLAERMRRTDPDGIGMLTSRTLARVDVATAELDGVAATVLATAGLSNAVRVGDTPGPLRGWGTINLAARVDQPLSDVALLEALSIVTEARTAAVMDAQVVSRRSEGISTGTGTDCIAVLAAEGASPSIYAGKHTSVGHVLGRATYDAVAAALARWKEEVLR